IYRCLYVALIKFVHPTAWHVGVWHNIGANHFIRHFAALFASSRKPRSYLGRSCSTAGVINGRAAMLRVPSSKYAAYSTFANTSAEVLPDRVTFKLPTSRPVSMFGASPGVYAVCVL